MPDPNDTLEALLLRKATSIGPQPQNALGQDLPLPEGQDYPSKVVEFLKGLGGFGEGRQGSNALGQVLGIAAPVGTLSRSGDLTIDVASRMKRAKDMGFNMDVYHGIRPGKSAKTSFDKFEYQMKPWGDAGIHVDPDPDVANIAAASSIKTKNPHYMWSSEHLMPGYQSGAQILPLKAKIRHPLELSDMGLWSDPKNWLHGLEDAPDTGIYQELREAASKALDSHFQGKSQWPETFKNILKRHGYDSIEYPNASEGTGGMSYMLLDPNQLRSRFAMFDPARAKSGDLLASLLAGVGLSTAASREKK